MFADFENLLFCLTATVLHPFFSTFQWEMIHRSWNEITDMEAMKNDIVETIERGGKRERFYNSNFRASFFALQYEKGKNLDINGPEHEDEKSVQRLLFLYASI